MKLNNYCKINNDPLRHAYHKKLMDAVSKVVVNILLE
jgi:hypothetical protein